MIYTPLEYAQAFTFGGKHLSAKSIKRRCISGLLPRNHKAHRKLGGWIIEVPDIPQNILDNYNLSIKLKSFVPN